MILCCGFNVNMCIMMVLLDLYVKLGRLEDLFKVFFEIIFLDSMVWIVMFVVYVIYGYGRDVIKYFEFMVDYYGISFDYVIFIYLLSVCSYSGFVEEGKYYFEIMLERYRVELRLDYYLCMVDLMG